MYTNNQIHELHYCRNCLNEKCNLRLEREEVLIHSFLETCNSCGEVKNIVSSIKTTKRWKLLFGKDIS